MPKLEIAQLRKAEDAVLRSAFGAAWMSKTRRDCNGLCNCGDLCDAIPFDFRARFDEILRSHDENEARAKKRLDALDDVTQHAYTFLHTVEHRDLRTLPPKQTRETHSALEVLRHRVIVIDAYVAVVREHLNALKQLSGEIHLSVDTLIARQGAVRVVIERETAP